MMVYIFALLLGIAAWAYINYLSKSKGFVSRPIHEQQKIKKGFLWAVYGGLALGCLLAWFMQNGITSWVPYLVGIIYLLIWAGGGYLFWLAYVFGIRRDTTRIKKYNGAQLGDSQNYLFKFAILNFVCGCALLIIAVAIPLLKINLKNWLAMIVMVLVCRNFAIAWLEKANSKL